MENTWGLGLISTNREGTKRYFHFDGLGSTWALTDYDETVTDTYAYSAFGTTTTQDSANGPAVNPFMYLGRLGAYDDGARGSTSHFIFTASSIVYDPEHDRVLGSTNAGGPFSDALESPTLGDFTNKDCIAACRSLYPVPPSRNKKFFDLCYWVCKTLKGKTCNQLSAYCAHLGRAGRKQETEICLVLYNKLCPQPTWEQV